MGEGILQLGNPRPHDCSGQESGEYNPNLNDRIIQREGIIAMGSLLFGSG